ncbi:hypothetical protein HPP92_020010 [Vanilla planifolia]|uniref:Uncharacterized protein n=1 Tax=Vanilla planifolia TaxID=51239 RepID=A0A835Q7S0_VANPL|nr:hypothetical protein HPP92_020441 [Vanilla planifolia]KAG0465846.1 hypothetical protein HPP92_020010 [Vanilla planifolia]
MDYSRILAEPKVPQPSYSLQIGGDFLHQSAQPIPQPQLYGGVIHLRQQPLSHCPYPTNPNLSNSQTPLRLPDPYAPHGGCVGKAPAAAGYSLSGAVSSAASLYPYSMAIGNAVEGSCGYVGGEAQRTFAAKEAIRQFGGHPLGYVVIRYLVLSAHR